MTFRDRTTRASDLRSWPGDMEADYRYTTGVAGERFFTALQETGKLMAARCDACGKRYLPPRMYCETDLSPLGDWSPVKGAATVESATVVHVGEDGERLETPEVWAVLRWEGITGGLVHRLDVPPNTVKPGLKVRPVLRPKAKRVGNITDIRHFAP